MPTTLILRPVVHVSPPIRRVNGSRKPKLSSFRNTVCMQGVIEEFDSTGYKPGTVDELRDFVAKNYKIQRTFTIIALGSIIRHDGSALVATLNWRDTEPSFEVFNPYGLWDPDCYRFFAVPK